MNRREFFKGAAALAAVAPLASKEALAHAAKPKAGNNPICQTSCDGSYVS